MLKEEKELRACLRKYPIPNKQIHLRQFRLVTALVCAVREECAKVADDLSGKWNVGNIEKAGGYNEACMDIATALRRKPCPTEK